ncbi:low molecular weight protein-tyrosine-phosphatase [Gallaecimonas sp. GXIMD1310]|uniref:low molecular weight protein-tyrosine-phosphatase n=1 Tax=Gallaecimonas sp. GXIMD1310 TaxID=3131926 RepID=UPI003872E3E3
MVCVGNICRSPTAEFLMQAALPEKNVSSAGIAAVQGHDMDATARAVAEARGHHFAEHTARQLTRSLCQQAELILVMEPRHRDEVGRLAPEALGKTFLLGKWLGDKAIPDPYRKSTDVFEFVFEQIEAGVNAWQQKLNQ